MMSNYVVCTICGAMDAHHCTCTAYTAYTDQSILLLQNQVAQQQARIDALIMFADTIIAASFDGCGMDGGDIQDAALNSGLLRRVTATQPCGDHCACAEYSFPSVCCRKTYTTPPQEDQL